MSKILLDDELLKDAVSIYQDRYFAKTEFNESEFETSSKFDNKIKKMIKSEHSLYHRMTLTNARKVICVFVAILTLIVSSVGAEATKNILGGFYITPGVGDDEMTEAIEEDASYPQKIEKYYEVDIPNEFKLVKEDTCDSWAYYYYESEVDIAFINFEQYVRGVVAPHIDNMHTQISEVEYKGQEYFFAKSSYGGITLWWNNGEYLFSLYSNALPQDVMFEICASLKEK